LYIVSFKIHKANQDNSIIAIEMWYELRGMDNVSMKYSNDQLKRPPSGL